MKPKLIIINIILFLFLPLHVQALSGTVKITCDDSTITLNKSTTCHITATTDDEVSSIHSEINISSGLELTSVVKSSIWEGDNDKVLDLYTAENKTGSFEIADFTIKAVSIGTHKISLTDTTLGDKSFKEYSFTVSPYSITVSNESTNNNSSSKSSSSSTASSQSNNQSSNSSSNKSSSSASSKQSSSKSSAPSSNQSSSNSSSPNLRKPIYIIELNDNEISVGKTTELSFSANTAGLIKVTSSNSNIITTSSTSYNLSQNETKVFKLLAKKKGTANVIIEFIPENEDEYQTIKESHKITVQNISNQSSQDQNANVDVNPPTGSIALLIITIIGITILGYSYWYYRTNKQH